MECPSHCPMKCGPEEMHCGGGMDFNGCQQPDSCIAAKGFYFFKMCKIIPVNNFTHKID